jgi:predicted metal-dependent hydrolase
MSSSDAAIRNAVGDKMPWIRRHQERIAAQPQRPKMEFMSGESHFFLGNPYLLNVIEHNGPTKVLIHQQANIELYVRPNANALQRELILQQWYKTEFQALVPDLLRKWQPILGVTVAEWGIRKMKTRWGSCNTKKARIWLNLELIKKPIHCLEYVTVHEIAHLLEPSHNARFKAHMDRFLPSWRLFRKELNREPLA